MMPKAFEIIMCMLGIGLGAVIFVLNAIQLARLMR